MHAGGDEIAVSCLDGPAADCDMQADCFCASCMARMIPAMIVCLCCNIVTLALISILVFMLLPMISSQLKESNFALWLMLLNL